jgi:hypothetical protein
VFLLVLKDADEKSGQKPYRDLVAVAEKVGNMSEDIRSFGTIHSLLDQLRNESPHAVSMAECRRWCPQLARYSFYTRELGGTYFDAPGVARFADMDLGRETLTKPTRGASTLGDTADNA